MKRRTLKTAAVTLILAAAFYTAAFAGEDQFVQGSRVNGISIGGLTVEEAKAKIERDYTGSYELTIREKDNKTEKITGSEIGYTALVPEGLQAILDQQNTSGRNSGPAVDCDYTMEIPSTYDEAALTARIDRLNCISGADIVTTADARISDYAADEPFTIIPEVQGNNVDREKVQAAIKAAVADGLPEMSLEASGCYYTVTVTAQDEQLKLLCDTMNRCKDMVITYTFGEGVTEELTGEMISTWITGAVNGEIQVNRDAAAGYIAGLAGKYNTAGTARTLKTTSGREVSITGPYGWTIDQAAEIDALIGMIRTGQTQAREPQYSSRAASRTGDDWGNTYVEIDLTAQHVYMYQNGSLVWDASCVTGNVSKGYTTPPGIYSLTYKTKDRILRGKKKADGSYEYESHVDYWMPFNGGIGLHDANWRSKFGGGIYQKNGSHGCINLPPKKAKALYDLVYTGIPVLCYN